MFCLRSLRGSRNPGAPEGTQFVWEDLFGGLDLGVILGELTESPSVVSRQDTHLRRWVLSHELRYGVLGLVFR